jgi:hypothetical protein
MSSKNASNDSYDLFMGALDVTNDALDKLRDKPLVKDLVALMDSHAEGKKFGVAVYDHDSSTPHDYYTLRIHNRSIQLAARGKEAPEIDWKVPTDYLQKINDDPQAFIDNPLKLDLEWLKHRLEDAA